MAAVGSAHQRESDFAGLGPIGLAGGRCSSRWRTWPWGRAERLDCRTISLSFKTESSRETCQPTIFDVELRAEDGARRFRIDPDVVHSAAVRHIALAAGRAAHHHATADPLRETGITLERKRDVGNDGAQGHQSEAGLLIRERRGWRRLAPARARLCAWEPESRGSPRPPSLPWNQCAWSCARVRKRLLRTREDQEHQELQTSAVRSAFSRRTSFEADIAGDRRQAENADVRIGQRHR